MIRDWSQSKDFPYEQKRDAFRKKPLRRLTEVFVNDLQEVFSKDKKNKLCSSLVSTKLNWFVVDHRLRPGHDRCLRISSPIVLWGRLRLGSIVASSPLKRRIRTTRDKVSFGSFVFNQSGQHKFRLALPNEASMKTQYFCGLTSAIHDRVILLHSSQCFFWMGLENHDMAYRGDNGHGNVLKGTSLCFFHPRVNDDSECWC